MPAEVAARSEPSESQAVAFARWLLYVTVAALPLYVVRWHYGPLPTTLLETLIVITTAVYVVARWREGVRRPPSTPFDVPIVLLLVAGAISVAVPADHVTALGLYRAFFVEPVLLFYVAVDLVRDRRALARLLVAFAVGSSAFAFLNFAAFAAAVQAHTVHVGDAPAALYNNPNYVAMYMEPPVALATGLLLFGASARWRWFGAAWLAITGLALMLSFSKGGYIALVALGLLVVTAVPRWRVPLFLLLGVAAVAISRIPLVADRLVNTTGSIMARATIYGAALQMLRENPVFGLGLGGFHYLFRHRQPTPYPHDLWLAMWVELGLLGLVAFAVVFAGLLWRGVRAWSRLERGSRAAHWGALAAIAMWGVHGIVDTPYFKNDMSAEFWVLAAIVTAGVLLARGAQRAAEGVPK